MWQNSIVIIVLALCAIFIGRRFYRQWRAALDPNKSLSCDCGCSGCSTTACDERKE